MKMRNLLAMSLLTAAVTIAAVPVFAEEDTQTTEMVSETATEESTTEGTEAVTETETASETATGETAAEPISIKVLILPKFDWGFSG